MARKQISPEEEDDNRSKVNPFAKKDEESGVDLEDSLSERNSFINDDVDFPDDDDTDEPEVEDDLFW